ncbi:S8 family serine peptidase [bacterium]|nr:S8 family serine peptidase [bacterium]
MNQHFSRLFPLLLITTICSLLPPSHSLLIDAAQAQAGTVSSTATATAPLFRERRLASDRYLLTIVPLTNQHLQALRSVPGLNVQRRTVNTAQVDIHDNLERNRELLYALHRSNIATVEFNRQVLPALTLNDPEATPNVFEATNVATIPSSRGGSGDGRETAFNLTRGSSQIKIGYVDFNNEPQQRLIRDFRPHNYIFSFIPQPFIPELYHATVTRSVLHAIPNNSIGSAGSCPDCTLEAFLTTVPDRETLPFGEFLELLAQTERRGLDILNNSWGLDGPSRALKVQLERLHAQGVLMFAASGNDGAEWPWAPALHDEVVAVGALTSPSLNRFIHAPFSNKGVELSAVGTGVRAPIVVDSPNGPVVRYRGYSGTSFATPQIAGIAGLVMSAIAEDPQRYPVSAALSREERRDYVRRLLQRTARDIDARGFDHRTGYGLVDAHEALKRLEGDNRPTLANDLAIRFSEWLPQAGSFQADPWLSAFESRLSAVPYTELSLHYSQQGGQCIDNGYKIRRPKAKIHLLNPDLQIVSAQNATIVVEVGVDVAVELEQKISVSPANPVECLFGWDAISFPVRWSDNISDRAFIQLTLELTANGYRQTDLQRAIPQRGFSYQMPGTSVGGLAAKYHRFLDELHPALFVIEESIMENVALMAERMVQETLSFAPLNSSSYTRFRTENSPAGEVFLPDLSETHLLTTFSHDPNSHRTRSEFGADVPASSYRAGITQVSSLLPTGPFPSIQEQGDGEALIPANYYNTILENMFAQGLFSSRYVDELSLDVFTRTVAEPAGVQISADVQATEPPTITYDDAPQTDALHFGAVHIPTRVEMTVIDSNGAPFTRVLNAELEIPLGRDHVYKHHERENDREGTSSRYESRLSPDAPYTTVHIQDTGTILFPNDIVSRTEVETFLRETAAYTFSRTIGALSSWQTAAEKKLGFFGCPFSPAFGNNRPVYIDGKQAFSFRDNRDCWDLELGSYAPRQVLRHENTGGFSAQAIEFIPRVLENDPRSDLQSFTGTMNHPSPAGQPAAFVEVHFQALGSNEEVHTSINGESFSPFTGADREEIVLYEELWQASAPTTTSGVRRYSKWAPHHRSPRAKTVDLINIARKTEQKNIAPTCLPRATVEFRYDAGAPPLLFNTAYATDYEETPIFEPTDTWTPLSSEACQGSGTKD